MAVALARQSIGSLSSCCSSLTSSGSRAAICAPPASASAAAAAAVVSGGRIVAPLVLVLSPVQGRAQLSVTSRPGTRGSRNGEASNRGCFDDAVVLLASAPVLPKLVVLDLDFTVWPFYCYNRRVSDDAAPPTVYPQVVDIVRALAAYKVEMAIASRTPSVSVAKAFLEQLSISHHFPSMEIYFTIYSKTKHFTALKEKTGIPYSSMLFFDDETKNIVAASKLGVLGVLVTKGLDLESLEKGLNFLASKR